MAAPLAAQRPDFSRPPQPGQTPRFGTTVEVRVIELDAVVTDRDGNPVHGLTKDDFVVFEGRARQSITNFTEYRDPAEEGGARPANVDVPEPRTVVILVDSLPLWGPKRERVFGALRGFLERGVRPQDRVGIVYWQVSINGGRTMLEPTTDRDAVMSVLARIEGTQTAGAAAAMSEAEQRDFLEDVNQSEKGAQVDVEGFLETTARFRSEEHRIRMRRKTAALQRLIASLGSAPGRKVLLYVSHDFKLPESREARLSILPMFERVAQQANAQGVSIYAIHPHQPDPFEGAEARQSAGPPDPASFHDELAGLAQLTEPTGGLLEGGPASMENLAPRLAADLGSYYSIGYRARSDGSDRTREVRVEVKNPEYRVRSRRSYVEKSDETVARDQLVARLFSEPDGGDLAFAITRGEPRPARRNRQLVPITLTVPVGQLRFEEEKGKRIARIRVMVVAGNGIAEVNSIEEKSIPIVAPPDADPNGTFTYTFELLADEKGSRVAIGLFDERTGLTGYGGVDLRGGARGATR